MSEHPKWLRAVGKELAVGGDYGWSNTCEQASVAFEALERERDELRKVLQRMVDTHGKSDGQGWGTVFRDWAAEALAGASGQTAAAPAKEP